MGSGEAIVGGAIVDLGLARAIVGGAAVDFGLGRPTDGGAIVDFGLGGAIVGGAIDDVAGTSSLRRSASVTKLVILADPASDVSDSFAVPGVMLDAGVGETFEVCCVSTEETTGRLAGWAS